MTIQLLRPLNSFFMHPTCPSAADATTWRRSVSQGWHPSDAINSNNELCFIYNFQKVTNVMEHRQRYSHYLPLYQTISRTTSRAASFSKDGTRSPRGSKSGRPSSSLQSNAKRRSTMNSRDAAYDEAAELQRAIEASKGEKSGESTDGGTTRRGKRGRSESEE